MDTPDLRAAADDLDARPVPPPADRFGHDERAVLERYFTNVDDHVFALRNLPEVVKGALFARYSRSPKSIRRLFLDEFVEHLEAADAGVGEDVGTERAAGLYQRVFSEYGDDSVAQLGGAHVAVEEISNLMTKQLEWGRLAAYLEQSTRYIPYDMQVDGRWRYYRDPDVMAGPHAREYVTTLDAIFSTYASSIQIVLDWVRATWPQDESTSDFVYRNATKAKALDLLRGLLPAATTSNVGMFASGQAMEQLLLRLRASDLAEARHLGDRLLVELREVVPAFLTRVDVPNRGGAWSEYLAATRRDTRAMARQLLGEVHGDDGQAVSLVDWSPRDPDEAERLLVVGALYPHVDLSEEQLARHVEKLSAEERAGVLRAYVGVRSNRRHKPGRAFERVWYRFDVLGDYGGFRDLQRHRMLTIEWQPLSPRHGYDLPVELHDAGVADAYVEALERSADLYERLLPDHPEQAQYAVCFAYRLRYSMQVNARAAMQMLELRSTPQGHPAYRRIVQDMHLAIGEVAGHRAVADAMRFVDHGAAELERLDSERAAEVRRQRQADA